jgi:hypothetical protein
MNLDCESVAALVKPVRLIQECDTVPGGALRLCTPLQYPNGSQIDLFIEREAPLFQKYTLSDMGQTTAYLLDVQVKPWATNKRRQVIEDVCRSQGVIWRGGRFLIELEDADLQDLSTPMMRLGQACMRISDLAFFARLWNTGIFRDDVEEFLQSADLEYETDVTELGASNEPVKIDFRVTGETVTSLLLVLSAGSRFSSHNAANEIVVRWLDLGRRKPGVQRFTILDETRESLFKPKDIKRLDKMSSVIAFPTEGDELRASLAA